MFELGIYNSESDNPAFVTKRLNLLKRIVESFSDIVDRMALRATDKGLYIQAMDSMHVALVDVFLSSNFFSSFRCDREISITVPLPQFIKILKGLHICPSSRLFISCTDTPQNISIVFLTEDLKHEWIIDLYADRTENYEVPDIGFSNILTMPVEKFKIVMRSSGSFGEYLSFKTEDNLLYVKQNGDYTHTTTEIKTNGSDITVKGEDLDELEIAMKYIGLVNKFAPEDIPITVKFGKDAPVFFDLDLYGTLGYARLYIAPKTLG